MIVCRKCGYRNADADTFCGTCGSFLEWTGEKQQVVRPAEPAEEEAPEAEPAPLPKAGFFQRVMGGANAFIAGPRTPGEEVDTAAASANPGQRPASAAGRKPPPGRPGAAKPAAAKAAGSPSGQPAPSAKSAPPPPSRTASSPAKAAPPPPSRAAAPPPPSRPAAPPPPSRAAAPPPPLRTAAPAALPPPEPAVAPPSPPPRRAAPPPPPPHRAAPPPRPARSESPVAAALVAPVVPGSAQARAESAAKQDAPPSAAAASAPDVKEQAPQIARARAVAVTKTTSTRRLHPGDSICGYCGEGNPPTRKFCARCGESLVEAEHVKAPWWHRFRVKRGPRKVKLGTAPGKNAKGGSLHGSGFDFKHALGQFYRKARLVLAVAIVVAGAVYGIYPPFRTAVNSLFTSEKNKLAGIVDPKFAPIHAVKCTSNAQLKGHPATLACDGFFNNYWLARWAPSPEPSLTVTFAHPVTITRLILHNGAFGRYVQDGRPSSLHLVFSNEESFTITPQDTPQPQTFTIKHAILIKSIVFQVTATYQGTVGANVAISQIELFGVPLPG
jgi:hypothetical protein